MTKRWIILTDRHGGLKTSFSPLQASTYVLVKSNVEVPQLPPNGALPLRPALFQRTWRACREVKGSTAVYIGTRMLEAPSSCKERVKISEEELEEFWRSSISPLAGNHLDTRLRGHWMICHRSQETTLGLV